MNGRPITPARPPAPVEIDDEHPLPTPGEGSLAASIAELRRQAAAYRQLSLEWLTTDSVKARRLLIHAEGLEKRVVLLECASRLGAPSGYQPFRRHFLAGGQEMNQEREKPRAAEARGDQNDNDKINLEKHY